MPRDYAHRTRPRTVSKTRRRKSTARRTKSRRSPLRIILLFIFFIVLIAFAAFLLDGKTLKLSLRSHHPSTTVTKKAKPVQDEKKQKKDKPAVQEIKFDFYKMLPKMSVEVVSDQQGSVRPLSKKGHHYYVLQLASFNDGIDALTYRNKIKEEGFKPKISSVVRGDTTWYRVQIGPISSENGAQKISQRLQEKNINSVLLRVTH